LDDNQGGCYVRSKSVDAFEAQHGAVEFTRLLENKIIPLLRKQKGFEDEITPSSRAERKRLALVCGTSKSLLSGERQAALSRIPFE
jgi:hypothetical protein